MKPKSRMVNKKSSFALILTIKPKWCGNSVFNSCKKHVSLLFVWKVFSSLQLWKATTAFPHRQMKRRLLFTTTFLFSKELIASSFRITTLIRPVLSRSARWYLFYCQSSSMFTVGYIESVIFYLSLFDCECFKTAKIWCLNVFVHFFASCSF